MFHACFSSLLGSLLLPHLNVKINSAVFLLTPVAVDDTVLFMSEKNTSVALTEQDIAIVEWCRRKLTASHGPVSFTFIVRQALRALKDKLGGAA
jgi:hypothetical protein